MQNVLQWKFTACRYNIENTNGFKTFSMSAGLTIQDKEELVRNAGSYSCPSHLTDRPAPEELAGYPVTFSSFRLRSGKRAVVRTCYIGKDYAGVRWGNFFSHALILPDGFWDFHPIQLWESGLFSRGLSEEERELGRTPDPLPPLTVTPGDLRDWTPELDRFFQEPARRPILRAMISPVRGYKKTNRPVLFCDSQESLPLWIAAVSYAFPSRWSQQIAFSTYPSDPHSRLFALIGTIPQGTEQRMTFPTGDNSNCFFDITNNRIPKEVPDRWAALINFDAPPFPGPTLSKTTTELCHWDASVFNESPETILRFLSFLTGKLNTAENAAGVAEMITLLENQPEENILRALRFLTKNPAAPTLEGDCLEKFLTIFTETAASSRDEGALETLYLFFKKSFRVSPENASTVNNHRLALLRCLFDGRSENRMSAGKSILKRIKSDNDSEMMFLEFVLIGLISENFEDDLRHFGKRRLASLTVPTADRFMIQMFPAILARCDTREKHQALIGLFQEKKRDYFVACLKELSGLDDNRTTRKNAVSPVKIAFIDYLLRTEPTKIHSGETWPFDEFAAADSVRVIFRLSKSAAPSSVNKTYKSVRRQLVDLNKSEKKRLRKWFGLKTRCEKIIDYFHQILDSRKADQ